MVNGHIPHALFASPLKGGQVPEQLFDIKECFVAWVPNARKIKVGATFMTAFTNPRVPLENVWPAFAAWLILDETYGAKQYLPESTKLHDIATEIARLLQVKATGALICEETMQGLRAALLPFGERLTRDDNPSAGCAWQCVFNCADDVPQLALRYGLAANGIGQPGQKDVAVRAAINSYMGKVFDLLKV